MKKYSNLYQRGSTWYYRFNLDGKEFRGSCHTPIVRQAQKVVREKMAEAEKPPSPEQLRADIKNGIDRLPEHALVRAARVIQRLCPSEPYGLPTKLK